MRKNSGDTGPTCCCCGHGGSQEVIKCLSCRPRRLKGGWPPYRGERGQAHFLPRGCCFEFFGRYYHMQRVVACIRGGKCGTKKMFWMFRMLSPGWGTADIHNFAILARSKCDFLAIFATERRCTSRKKSSLRNLGSKKVGGRENIEFIRRNGVMFLCMSFITELRFRNG